MSAIFDAMELAVALAVGFGSALFIGGLSLRAIVGAITRNSYNVTNRS